MNKRRFCIFLSIFILIFIIEDATAMIVEQLGIYDTYQLAPEMGNTKVNSEGCQVIKIDRQKGYYNDNRKEFPEYTLAKPPNPKAVPKSSHPTRSVEPFESYYDRNIKGKRRSEYMNPIIPNYNRFYSTRRNTPYTRQEYMDVWCTGTKNYSKGLCTTDDYQIYFIRARNWAWGVTQMPFQSINARKLGKIPALFIMVDDLGLDARYMHDIKYFAEPFKFQLFFGTINSFIPIDWIT